MPSGTASSSNNVDQASSPPALKVVLVEDSPRLRDLLAGILREIEGIVVVGEANDEVSAVRLLQEQPADLVIVDLELRAGSGLGLLRTLAGEPGRFRRPRAVVFSNHDHPHLRERCRKLGAEKFFNKVSQVDDLIDFLAAARPAPCRQ